jgi:serine/threonine protein kinase
MEFAPASAFFESEDPPYAADENFVVQRALAASEFSSIYVATDVRTGEERVLKIAGRDSERAFARLLREYVTLVDVEHPNVIRTHGIIALDETTHAMVLDLVEGETLKERVRRTGPLPIATVADLLRSVAEGLQAVHELGWLHCDVKPANVVLRNDGTPVLLDFAIARSVGESTPSSYSGTPDFSSPEQLRSEPLDPRTDVYSFGATAYFLLTGRPPYLYADLDARFLGDDLLPPPSLATASGVPFPPDIENTIASMLALDRDDRPRSMRMVRALLDALDPHTLEFESSSELSTEVYDTPTVCSPPGREGHDTPIELRVDDAPSSSAPTLIADIHAPGDTICAVGDEQIVYTIGRRSLVFATRDGRPERVSPFREHDPLVDLALDPDGVLHAVTEGGTIVMLDPGDRSSKVVELEMELEELALGRNVALIRTADGDVRLSRDDYASWWCHIEPPTTAIAASQDGRWFAASSGALVTLYRLHPRSYELHATFSIPDEAVMLAVSDDGEACAATPDGALFIHDGDSTYHSGTVEGLTEFSWGADGPEAVAHREERLLVFQIHHG